MGDAAAPHGFRPASSADPTMLRRWISTPEVVHSRGDLDEQYDMLEADLYEPGMVMHIVTHDGRLFAYAQRYAEHIWPQPHFAALPAAARAIDDLIGAPDMFGAGHGSAFLRQLARLLIAEGAPLVAIDPDEAGLRQGRIRRRQDRRDRRRSRDTDELPTLTGYEKFMGSCAPTRLTNAP